MKHDLPFLKSRESLIFLTLLTVFFVEAAVMLFLERETYPAILDAFLVTMFVAPILAFLITKHIKLNVLQKAHCRISVLYNIDHAASRSLNLDVMLSKALDATLDGLDVEAGGIYLIEPDGETMILRLHKGHSEKFVENVKRIKLGEGISGRAAAYKKPIVLNVSEYPISRLTPYLIQEGLQTLASTPLLSGSKLVGALNLGARRSHAFPPEDIELLASIGQQLGIAVQNAILYKNVQQSEDKFRSLSENLPNMIFINKNGRVVYANKMCEEIMGYKIEELYHSDFDFLSLMAPEYIDITKKKLKRHIQGEEIHPYESTIITKSGKRIDVIIATKLIDYEGEKAVLGIMTDITERTHAEEDLKESEERFKSVVDSALNAVIVADINGVIISWNKSAEKKFIYTEEEILGKSISIIIPERYRKAHLEGLKHLNSTGEHTVIGNSVEMYGLRKDGTEFPMEFSRSIWKTEKGIFFSGIIHDITGRKKAEDALLASRELLQSFIDSSSSLIYLVDTQGRFLLSNSKLESLFGVTSDQLCGKTREAIMPKEIAKQHKENDLEVINTGEPISFEEDNYELDGKHVYLSVKFPVLDLNGNIYAVGGISTDITERKNIESLRFENERLENANKTKSAFIATMSHELRTPLNASIGFSELLTMGMAGELNEKQTHYLDNILTSNKFLLTLINDILDIAKIEAGKIELVPEKMSVLVTINETLSLIKETAMKHKVLLKTEFDPELVFIMADKQRFKQIMFNLLSNAVKFSKPEGGTITITAKKEGGMAQISVSDTGIGIKKEAMNKLFHEFEQIDSGISRKYGGTGLGLAITKQLLELHGGKIWAESKYGEGSTFTFTLSIKAKDNSNPAKNK